MEQNKKTNKVKLTVTESRCRSGYCKKGDEFIVDDLCPPLCHELWNRVYPYVFALQNGGDLDYGSGRARAFDVQCPDGGRVCIHGEVIDEKEDVCILTRRLSIRPMRREEMDALIRQSDSEMSEAYRQMLCGCITYPQDYLWYSAWEFRREETGEVIGDGCFKGRSPEGWVEIGYGINPGFEGQGYATEAVMGLCRWAFAQPGILKIEAETEPGNRASQRMLEKAGFLPTGVTGAEGPRFALMKGSFSCRE